MKTLNDYTEAGMTKLLSDNGAFFAFGKNQFEEKKQEGVTYVSLDMGLICPKENAKTVIDGIIKNGDDGIKQDLAENGILNIIKRELANHEAYYTGDIDSTVDALEGYEIITREEIAKVFRMECERQCEA